MRTATIQKERHPVGKETHCLLHGRGGGSEQKKRAIIATVGLGMHHRLRQRGGQDSHEDSSVCGERKAERKGGALKMVGMNTNEEMLSRNGKAISAAEKKG